MPASFNTVDQQTMEDNSEDARNAQCEIQRNSFKSHVPLVAVPEKIILCVDISQDYTSNPYTFKDDASCSPFLLLKKALSNFISNKHSFNSNHEFAVMSLEPGGVKWIQDFSNDPKEVISAVNSLELICLTESLEVNLTHIFKEIHKQTDLPQVKIETVRFPDYVVRLVLLYNSSYNIPIIDSNDETFRTLSSSKYFYWDTLYLHDAPVKENKCQEVFDELLGMSSLGSYVFESSRKIIKVFNTIAKLLAHPLQRFEVSCEY